MIDRLYRNSHREAVRTNLDIFALETDDLEYMGHVLHKIWRHITTLKKGAIVEFSQAYIQSIPTFIQTWCQEAGLYCNDAILHDWNTHTYRMEISLPPSEIQREKRNNRTFVLWVGVAASVATLVGLTPRDTGMKDFSAITYTKGIKEARIGVKDGFVRCLEGDAGEIKLGDNVYAWPRNDNRITNPNTDEVDNSIKVRGENDYLGTAILEAPAQVSENPDLLCHKND